MSDYYYYGMAAVAYLTTCWMFAAVRWFHTCREPKERRAYIWPDRKLQCLLYVVPTVLLPYALDPTDEAAWTLAKSYFPATYYFYCGVLLLCFFGTVKQWHRWRTASWVATVVVVAAMLPPVLNAWLPITFVSAAGMSFWLTVITAVSLLMMVFCGLSMWQVRLWLLEVRDANYSNPDDFPTDYARRVLAVPLVLTPLVWPAYIFDSRCLMTLMLLLMAVFNVVFLLTALPVWRRKALVAAIHEDHDEEHGGEPTRKDGSVEEQVEQTALEIRAYIEEQRAYLDPHLKIDDVVAHTRLGRTYVSLTFSRCFGSFASYVNGLRLAHYEQYAAAHPNETKEAAAMASGFSSYNAYYRARQRQQRP